MDKLRRQVSGSSTASSTISDTLADNIIDGWQNSDDDLPDLINARLKNLLQSPDLPPANASPAIETLAVDKIETETPKERNHPDAAAIKSKKLGSPDIPQEPDDPSAAIKSGKPDTPDATSCMDMRDVHLPPLHRIYPLSTLRNLMFGQWEKAWRFALDSSTTPDARLFHTEVSMWTFDLDSVRRNGGFSLPPASITVMLQDVNLAAVTRAELKRKHLKNIFCKLTYNSGTPSEHYKLRKKWVNPANDDSANDDYYVSSVQSLASKHAVDPRLVQYTPKDRFTFNAAGTLRQPSTTGTDDRNFISLRVELWAASADPFANKSRTATSLRPISVSLSSPITGAAANASPRAHTVQSSAHCKRVVARLRNHQLRHLGSAVIPVYWCRNTKIVQPIMRSVFGSAQPRPVAHIKIKLNVDWMAGAGFLRAAVPVEIKPSRASTDPKHAIAAASAAAPAGAAGGGADTDAHAAEPVTAETHAGSGDAASPPPTDTADAGGLWQRPKGFERLMMPLGKQGSLSIVPPDIPSPRSERPSVFPRIYVNESGGCVLLMQLFFHVELGEELKKTKLMAHMPEHQRKAMSKMRVFVPVCAVGTFPFGSKLQHIMARRLHRFYQTHLKALTTADAIWGRASELLTALRYCLTGPTSSSQSLSPQPKGHSPKDKGQVTPEEEMQALAKAHCQGVNQFGAQQHQFCSPDAAGSKKTMEWSCCSESGAQCDWTLLTSKHYYRASPSKNARRRSGCFQKPPARKIANTLSRPTAYWSTPITPIMAAPLRLPPVDVDFSFILQTLPAEVLVKAFVTALTDGTVVLLVGSVDSPNTIVITSIFEALQCLLWPLHWVNPYIPLLPFQCKIPPFSCMCGFVVGHSEDGSKPDLEGYDRYVIIDLDADGSDPDGMIYRSSGLLEMPLSLTDPLLCAAHAAKTLNQCLNTMDPTDVVDMLPAWRAAIFRLRLAAVGVVNSVLWRLPYFCRPEREPQRPNTFLVYKRNRIQNAQNKYIEIQKRPGVTTKRKDGDDEGERSVKNFSPVKVIRYKNYRGKPFALVEGSSSKANELLKGYLPTSWLFPTNDIFFVRRDDGEECTWLRSEPTDDNNSKVMLPNSVRNGARVRVRWWSPDKKSIPISVFGWVWCFSSGKQGYIRREYLSLCTASDPTKSSILKAHSSPSQLNHVTRGVLRNPDVTPQELLEYLMRRFGSQHLLNEHPMLETLLKRIKIRRRSSSAGSDALSTPTLLSNPDALADSQLVGAASRSPASSAASIALPPPATSSDNSSHCNPELKPHASTNSNTKTTTSTKTGDNTLLSHSHNADINSTAINDLETDCGLDLKSNRETEPMRFDRLQFLRQFSACEDGHGRSGVPLEFASRVTESQPFEQLKSMLLECMERTVVRNGTNILTPFEAQHWLCM